MITRYNKNPEPALLKPALAVLRKGNRKRGNRPFSLYLITRSDGGKTHTIGQFTEDEDTLFEGMTPALTVTENQDIALYFDAPPDYRLTMDGLDVVSLPGTETIDGLCYIKPMGQKKEALLLFEGKDFPLVPGYYVITVKGNHNTWYSLIEITPKFMGKQSWQDMRDELTEEIRTLSFDFIKTNVHISKTTEQLLGLEADMLLRFYTINNEWKRVMKVLSELARTANARLKIAQTRKPVGKETASLPGEKGEKIQGAYTYSKQTQMTYDLPENRFAKAILQKLHRHLTYFIKEIDRHLAQLSQYQKDQGKYKKTREYRRGENAESQLENYKERAQTLRNAICLIADAPWYQETKDKLPAILPMTVFRDPRYAVIYRLYRNLKHPEDSLTVASFYQFQWKRTDKLYELWCFLQFIKALEKNDWEPEKGPAVEENHGRYTLSGLEAGTEITLRRGDDHIRLTYDGLVPQSSQDTTRDQNPLYTNNAHRRPDLRLDYYRNGAYHGSLAADFKYRDIYYLWRDPERSAGIRIQFNAYRDMNTKYYRDMDETESLRNSRPIKEVWAIFPKDIPEGGDDDYNLKFISLAPGLTANDKLAERLEKYIQSLA